MQQVHGVCIRTYVPWKVEPLLLQVGVQPLHDLVQEVHTSLQPLIQVGHLGGLQYLRGWVEQWAGRGQWEGHMCQRQ